MTQTAKRTTSPIKAYIADPVDAQNGMWFSLPVNPETIEESVHCPMEHTVITSINLPLHVNVETPVRNVNKMANTLNEQAHDELKAIISNQHDVQTIMNFAHRMNFTEYTLNIVNHVEVGHYMRNIMRQKDWQAAKKLTDMIENPSADYFIINRYGEVVNIPPFWAMNTIDDIFDHIARDHRVKGLADDDI